MLHLYLYIDKHRKVGREKYFAVNTNKNFLKSSEQGEQENVCAGRGGVWMVVTGGA